MRKADFYRYFLGIRPDTALRNLLASLYASTGQGGGRVKEDHLHLTFCVIAESPERSPFVLRRAEVALAGHSLSSCPIRLGRVRGGPLGLTVYTIGQRAEISAFYGELEALLLSCGITPLYRKSGLNPHVTLGRDPIAFDPFRIAHRWEPNELLLIESEIGLGVHNVLARWPLAPTSQGSLPLGDPPVMLPPHA